MLPTVIASPIQLKETFEFFSPRGEREESREREPSREGGKMARVVGGEEELEEFYVRYYVGHKGKFGHKFLEFEFRSNGMLRYANNSNYKNDTMICKEVCVTPSVLKECRRIILKSEVSLSLLFFTLTLFFRVLVFC